MKAKHLLAVVFVAGLLFAAYAYGEGHGLVALTCMAVSLVSVLFIKPANKS